MVTETQQPSVNVYPSAPYGGYPMYGNGGNDMFGNNGAWWIIILFLFAMMGGWGNNNGNNSNGVTYIPYGMGMGMCNGGSNYVQQGFDQAAIMSGLNGIQTSLANAEVSRCNSQANILQTLNANQNANVASMNSLAMGLQNCCCENRAGLADLKYTVATENCADRSAVSEGIRDVMENCNRNNQAVLDKLCQMELDGVKQNYEGQLRTLQSQISSLQNQLTAANTATMVGSNTSRILADNAAQTTALEQYLNPAPIPAYVVQNPNCCAPAFNDCCGNVA